MNFIIKQELAQAILNYLQTKPYAEVSGLIAELVKMEQFPKPEPQAVSEQVEG